MTGGECVRQKIKNKLTAAELEGLLAIKAFTPVMNELTAEESKSPEVVAFEDINYFRYSIEDYREEHKTKKLPTPYEYSEAYQKNAKRIIFSKNFKHKTKWKYKYTKALHKAIWNRATKTYISYMVEYHTKLVLREIEGIEVISNKRLDLKGIDLLIRDYKLGVQVPVHIYKCSSSGLIYRYKKEGKLLQFKKERGNIYARAVWIKYENRNYNKRNTKAHLNLFYQDVEEDNGLVNNINGYPLLKSTYIKTRYEEFTTVKWAYLYNLFNRFIAK